MFNRSPLVALRHRPSLELGLRRLYAIMHAEKQVTRGDVLDKATAWQNVEFLLESTPDEVTFCYDIEEEMTRSLTQSRRRITASKGIMDSEYRKGKKKSNSYKAKQKNKKGDSRLNKQSDNKE